MISPLRRATQVAGERVAVRCGAREPTYAETWERCTRIAGLLRDLGLARGDRVAVAGANCHRYLELYPAIPAAGLVVVPLDHRHGPAELRHALEEAKSVERSVVITIETDRNARVGGFESWWDVPVAAVSEQESVRSAREQYDVHRAAERWLL